jgi:hypothetical protein
MSLESRAETLKCVKFFPRKIAAPREDTIITQGSVAFGEHKTIPSGPLWIGWVYSHFAKIECDENLDLR